MMRDDDARTRAGTSGRAQAVIDRPASIMEHIQGDPDILIVTVTYNSQDVVEDFLRALPGALAGVQSARVVVVDNASSDETVAVVKSLAPWADVLDSGRNAGYAGGINVALRRYRANSGILVLNPDTEPGPGSVSVLAAAAGQPGVGLAVPRILDPDGNLKFSLRREPTLLRALGEALLGGHRAARFPQLGDMIRDPSYYRDGATADWATGAAIYISRPVLDDVGLWDESFFLYSEETDYALRARDAGWELRLAADASVAHPGGEMSRSTWLWSILALNRVKLYRLRHGAIAGAVYWVVVFLNEGVRALMGRPTHKAAAKALLGISLPRRPDRLGVG